MNKLLICSGVVLASAIGAIAASAQQAESSPPASNPDEVCLQVNRVYSWETVNQQTLAVKDMKKTKFRVELNGDCAYSHFMDKIIFRPVTTSYMGCVGPGDHVTITDRMGQVERCVIRDVSLYTDAQMRIDERQARPEAER